MLGFPLVAALDVTMVARMVGDLGALMVDQMVIALVEKLVVWKVD